MDSEEVAHSRNSTVSPSAAPAAPLSAIVASAKTDLAHDAIAALAARRTSPANSGSVSPGGHKDDKDSAENTIHASGLSPPPPPSTSSTAQPSNERPSTGHREQQQPSPVASPPQPKVRRPLPSAAPADLAASTGLIPGFPRRESTTSYATGAPSGHQDKMPAFDRDAQDPSTGPVNSTSSRHSITNGDRPPMNTNGHFPARAYEDEIIVDTKSNSLQQSSPIRVASEHEDVPMDDANARDRSPGSYNKRRRSSTLEGVDESSRGRVSPTYEGGGHFDAWRQTAKAGTAQAASPQPQNAHAKSTPLGYWRDSTVPEAADRHAVIGFIDTRDRLRTRVHQFTRSGKPVSPKYPFPPGPGGSWVTFERVVFEKHLIGMDHNQIKEYVKLRIDALGTPETPEEAALAEKAAVKEAMRRAALHPVPDNQPPPQIAYGEDLPDYVVNASRPEKKRRMGSHYGVSLPSMDPGPSALDSPLPSNGHLAQAGSASVVSAIQRSAIDLLPGTRPTRILLGYWRGSSEERVEDKHAVMGILGANDMFRVKVTRETRDGRSILGNYPQGAGALWIHYDEVEFEKHIRHLSRPEVKEYVRVRQRQIDEGEKPSERSANEAKAVYDAQARVINAGGAAQSTLGTSGRLDTISFATAANLNREAGRIIDRHDPGAVAGAVEMNGISPSPYLDGPQDGRARRESSGSELRQSRRSTLDVREPPVSTSINNVVASGGGPANPLAPRGARHSLPAGPGLAANRPPPVNDNADRVERTNSLARREITRMESIQQRNEQRASNSYHNGALANVTNAVPSQHNGIHATNNGGGSAGGGSSADEGKSSSRQTFSENIGRLNKVWASQEASRIRSTGNDDTKIYMGVKYERKPTGPFQGKLVSPGTILSIDGEDYVEYRVLTKPTFF
ncbi:hypothetical protein Sste5346_004400 [Sporothrix stenoceras]|uniref:Uncharacterized protein n=1 Tax=Sporothrix stenoceras TaxID=5173 RepID=A0ABR3Z943_9PEZI